MPEAIVILEVIEGMVLGIPLADYNGRVSATLQVLKAVKSGCNLIGNDPLEMMCRINSWWFRQMKMGMINQVSLRILCSFVKPNQFTTILWLWKFLQGCGVEVGQKFVPEVLRVVGCCSKPEGRWSPLDGDKPGGWIVIPLVVQEYF